MAKTKISEFSSTPGNNTDIDSINIAEGCAPSGINDAIRELMAQLKDFQTGAQGDSFNGPVGTSTAAAGAFTTLTASSTATLNTLASSGATLTGGSINNMAIGGTTAAAVSATTLTTSSTVTLNGGSASGVAYLNGSKVLTTGSALTFDGTSFGVGGAPASQKLEVYGSINARSGTVAADKFTNYGVNLTLDSGGSLPMLFQLNGSEQMRLTSTGLGMGTSSPNARLDVTQLTSDTTNGMTLRGYTTGSDGARTFNINTVSSDLNNWANLNFKAQQFTFSIQGTEKARIDSSGNLGLGVTPDASAILDAQSTTKGVRLPNMTTTQKNAISSPAAGLMVFDTALAKLCVYTGASWQTITSI